MPKDLSATRRTLHTVFCCGHCAALRGPIPGQDFVYIGVHVDTLLPIQGVNIVAILFHFVGGMDLLECAIFMAVPRNRGGAAPALHTWRHTFLIAVFEASPAVAAPAAGSLAPHVIAFRVEAAHCIVCPGSLSNRDIDADGVYSVIY